MKTKRKLTPQELKDNRQARKFLKAVPPPAVITTRHGDSEIYCQHAMVSRGWVTNVIPLGTWVHLYLCKACYDQLAGSVVIDMLKESMLRPAGNRIASLLADGKLVVVKAGK